MGRNRLLVLLALGLTAVASVWGQSSQDRDRPCLRAIESQPSWACASDLFDTLFLTFSPRPTHTKLRWTDSIYDSLANEGESTKAADWLLFASRAIPAGRTLDTLRSVLDKAIDIYARNGDTIGLAHGWWLLSRAYLSTRFDSNSCDSVLHYNSLTIDHFSSRRDFESTLKLRRERDLALSRPSCSGRIDERESNLATMLALAREQDRPDLELYAVRRLGQLYLACDQYDSAFQYGLAACLMIEPDDKQYPASVGWLADIYEAKGDFAMARAVRVVVFSLRWERTDPDCNSLGSRARLLRDAGYVREALECRRLVVEKECTPFGLSLAFYEGLAEYYLDEGFIDSSLACYDTAFARAYDFYEGETDVYVDVVQETVRKMLDRADTVAVLWLLDRAIEVPGSNHRYIDCRISLLRQSISLLESFEGVEEELALANSRLSVDLGRQDQHMRAIEIHSIAIDALKSADTAAAIMQFERLLPLLDSLEITEPAYRFRAKLDSLNNRGVAE